MFKPCNCEVSVSDVPTLVEIIREENPTFTIKVDDNTIVGGESSKNVEGAFISSTVFVIYPLSWSNGKICGVSFDHDNKTLVAISFICDWSDCQKYDND